MSFRNRLTLFFVLIVIVPLVAVGVVVFRLIDENQRSTSDARAAADQTAAIGLYRREVERASQAASRVGGDRALARALRSGDLASVRARAQSLSRALATRRIVVTSGSRTLLDVGEPDSTAAASRRLIGSSGATVGTLQVSVTTARELTDQIHKVTGVDAVVTRGGRTLSSSLVGAAVPRFPRAGTVHVDGHSYRVASFQAPGFKGEPVHVAVLSAVATSSADRTRGRTVAAIIIVGFLIVAFVFAVLVSRSLQSEIERFLAAARRLAGGDFSTEVPTAGNDEFAALGEEFNKMSRQLESRLEELRQERARLEESVRRIGETFASNLDREGLLEIVLHTAVDAIGAGGGRATVRDAPGAPLEQRAAIGALGEFGDVVTAAEALALESGQPAENTADGQSALAFPLGVSGGRVLGLITVARAGRPFNQGEQELFHYLAGQAAVSIENVDLHELVQRQAVTDELTALFNHRRFQEVMVGEVERARRFEQPLGLVMLDIDDFKSVNDTYGHQQGDLVLREVAGVLRESSREIDEPARYGGEELAVALPQTDLEGAYLLAERVRSSIEGLEIPRLDGGGVLRITASFGVAAMPETAGDKDALIAAADAALYRAKRGGKNRTERAGPAPTKTAPAG